MGSLISRLVEKAKHEDTSRHGRRRHRSRSEKRERSRIQDSALDMLILAAAELIKIEIDNARIRRAQAGRQRPSRPGAMREGNLHDGMRVDGRRSKSDFFFSRGAFFWLAFVSFVDVNYKAGFVPGNHEAARQPPHRVPGNGIPGPGNLDIPPYGNDADAYSDLSLRGGRKPGSHIRRNPDKKRER